MVRTLVLSEIFPPRHGGSGRWFFELYRRLPRRDFRIAAGAVEGSDSFDTKYAASLAIIRLPFSSKSWALRSLTGARFYWRGYRAIVRIVRNEGIQAMHCGRCLPEGVFGWILNRTFGLPYLCYVHGEDIQTAAASRELSWMIRRVFAGASVLIANSHNTAALLKTDWQIGGERLCVLHPGVDADRFQPGPPDPERRAALGWGDRPVILTVGRLQRRKGHDMLIRALPRLLERHPTLLYAVAGDGEERGPLEVLARDLGVADRVQWLGEVGDEELLACYQQCTLFALPNRADGDDIEGFGMVLVEAQACGRPVLAGNSGGTAETMIEGETGIIADCTAPAPLAEALLSLLDDPERLRAMGEAGRRHVAATLDWGPHTARARELFQRLEEPGQQ